MFPKCFCEEPLSLEPDAQEWCATSCGHMFHYLCLTQWRERVQNCPTCRKTVLNHHVIRLYPATSDDQPKDDINKVLQTCLESTQSQIEQMQRLCVKKDGIISKLKVGADNDKNCRQENEALRCIMQTFHGESLEKLFDDPNHFEEVLRGKVELLNLGEHIQETVENDETQRIEPVTTESQVNQPNMS